jgi:hypothetical protein
MVAVEVNFAVDSAQPKSPGGSAAVFSAGEFSLPICVE